MARIKSFPLLSLRVITPRLTLRPAQIEELDQLAQVSKGNILEKEKAHFFNNDWPFQKSPAYEENFIKHYWHNLSAWEKDNWTLNLTIFYKHNPIGEMSLGATNFENRKSIITGSWILSSYRKRGLGVEARAGALFLGFNKIGAATMASAAHKDNTPSHNVSKTLGYKENGIASTHSPEDTINFLITKEEWETHSAKYRKELDPELFKVKGFKHCAHMF